MSLTTSRKVQKLQAALHAKAKGAPELSVLLPVRQGVPRDVLAYAYACCQANGGAAGVDGQTFEDIEAYGVERWLGELAEELQEEDVSTAGGAAGLDSQAGRQAAAAGDSDDQGPRGADGGGAGAWSRSSRPTCNRSSTPTGRTAVRWTRCKQVHALLNTGHTEVVDADLSGYFDSIPHAELMKSRGPSGQRQARAASDQDVAGSAGGRDGRARATRIGRPATRTRDAARRKGRRSRRCWPTSTCGGSCWAGRRWGTSSGCRRTSSTTPTTS